MTKWKYKKIGDSYEYETEKPKPLDFWETYTLLGSVALVFLLIMAFITSV